MILVINNQINEMYGKFVESININTITNNDSKLNWLYIFNLVFLL